MRTLLATLFCAFGLSAFGQFDFTDQGMMFACGAKPAITVQPVSVTCITNTTTNFSVTATGPNLVYQWQTNSVNVADNSHWFGSTTATLWVSNVTSVDSNLLVSCVVASPYGSVASSAATLTVTNGASGGGGGWGTPLSNTDGTVALAWYVADDATGTVTSWADRGSNGWHLTNSLSGKSPVAVTALSGHKVLVFDGVDDFLKSASFAAAQPNEYIFVAALTNGANQIYFDCVDGGNRQLFFKDSDFDAGLSVTLTGTVYNKWIVFDLVFNGASSAGYMTNTLSASGNTGANSQGGLTLAGRFGLDSGRFANLAMAEFIAYGGSGFVPGTNAAWRLNVFSYLTNKYALP